MKKLALTTLVLVAFVGSVFATAQRPDKIVYKGETYSLHSNPLEAYFAKNPDRKPKTDITSSALWRGYVATFEVKDQSIYLKDVQIQVRKKNPLDADQFEIEWQSALNTVVRNGESLKVDWLTGLLVIPHGKRVRYVHMGYASTYENYILLEVANGNFVKEKRFGHKEYSSFKQRQFAAFKKTEKYQEMVADIKRRNPDSTDEFIDRFLSRFVINYSSRILVD